MADCRYRGCEEKVFESSDYCILHVEFPEDEKSEEFKRLNKLKDEKIQKKISENDYNFEGVRLFRLIFVEERFNDGTMNFLDAKIKDHVEFYKCNVIEAIIFNGAELDLSSTNENKIGYLLPSTIR